jgi:hypothetical protein
VCVIAQKEPFFGALEQPFACNAESSVAKNPPEPHYTADDAQLRSIATGDGSLNCSRASMGPVGDSAQSFDFGVAPSSSLSAPAAAVSSSREGCVSVTANMESPCIVGNGSAPFESEEVQRGPSPQEAASAGFPTNAAGPDDHLERPSSSESAACDPIPAEPCHSEAAPREEEPPCCPELAERLPSPTRQSGLTAAQPEVSPQSSACNGGLSWVTHEPDAGLSSAVGVTHHRQPVIAGVLVESEQQVPIHPGNVSKPQIPMQWGGTPRVADAGDRAAGPSFNQPSSVFKGFGVREEASPHRAARDASGLLSAAKVREPDDVGVEGVRECKGSYAAAMDATRKRTQKEMEQRARLAAELAKRKAHVAAREQKAEKEKGVSKSPARGQQRGGYAPKIATPNRATPSKNVKKPTGHVPSTVPHGSGHRGRSGDGCPSAAPRVPLAAQLPFYKARAAGDGLEASFELSDGNGSDDGQELPDDWEAQIIEPQPALSQASQSRGPRPMSSKFANSPLAAALMQLMGLPGLHAQYSPHAPPRKEAPPPSPPEDELLQHLTAEENALLKSLSRLDPQMLRKSLKVNGPTCRLHFAPSQPAMLCPSC